MKNLKFIKNSNWNEVFQTWKENEGQDKIWQDFAVNEKGWNSWDEWRQYQSTHIDAQNREWEIYEILEPNSTIPKFQIGPFRGWQNNYEQEEKNSHTFEELVRDKNEWVRDNIGIQSRMNNFPNPSQFIGVYVEDEDKVILYEGHHRAAAIALAEYDKNSLNLGTITIAITKVDTLPKEKLDKMLELGTENSNTQS